MTFKRSGLGCNKVEQVRESALSAIPVKVAALFSIDGTRGDCL